MERTITVESDFDTTAAALARRLNTMSNYREKEMGKERAVVSVGKQFLMRLIGVYLYSNYTAPVTVTVEKDSAIARVTLASPSLMVVVGKGVEFFDHTFDQIESQLK